MKKELFCYLTFLLCVAICFVSCSDKDETIVCPIKNFTFTDVSGLALTYSGKPMLGKKVEFIPDAADATKARLILSGALVDLSDILGSVAMNSRAGITDLLKFASPGVIPGEKTTELHVTLNIDGDMVTFSGEEEQNGGIIRYNGSATKSFLKLDLWHCLKMALLILHGIWCHRRVSNLYIMFGRLQQIRYGGVFWLELFLPLKWLIINQSPNCYQLY